MYDLIYNFIYTYLFSGSLNDIESEVLNTTMSLSVWCSHCLTVVSIVLIFIFLVLFIKWLFKLVSGLFLLR